MRGGGFFQYLAKLHSLRCSLVLNAKETPRWRKGQLLVFLSYSISAAFRF